MTKLDENLEMLRRKVDMRVANRKPQTPTVELEPELKPDIHIGENEKRVSPESASNNPVTTPVQPPAQRPSEPIEISYETPIVEEEFEEILPESKSEGGFFRRLLGKLRWW